MSALVKVVLVATALGLTACGVRGPLELPPEAKAASQTAAQAPSGEGKAAGEAPKPHRPFVLDGLL